MQVPALLVGLLVLTSCSNGETGISTLVSDSSPVATPIETIETPATAPQSFISQQGLLEANGYMVAQNDAGEWTVFDQISGTEILRAIDEERIAYYTKDGEIEVPEESFVAREVAGVGVSLVLTIEDADGRVSEFFLNNVGTDGTEYRNWVTPINGQTDPELIETYPYIELEDVWSGRLLYSELLTADAFPAGTLVPEKFVYQRYQFPKGILVNLSPYFSASIYKDHHPDYQEFLNINNDYRRWISFYKSMTPSDEEVIVATQQFLSTDGVNSLFFHYVFGHEWPWDRDHLDAGKKVNLVDSIFLATSSENQSDYSWLMVPAPFFEGANEFDHDTFFSIGYVPRRPTTGVELYENPMNNPLLVRPDLPELVDAARQNTIAEAYLADVGLELREYQQLLIVGHGGRNIQADYFITEQATYAASDEWITSTRGAYSISSPFSLAINFETMGEYAGIVFFGRLNDPDSEWWEGIHSLTISNSGGNVILELHDGRAQDSNTYVELPNAEPGEEIVLRFLDISGKLIEFLNGNGELIYRLDVANLNDLSMPNGLFPDGMYFVEVSIAPGSSLVINSLHRIDE